MCIDTLVPMRVDLILIEYSFTTFHAEQLQSLIEEARARATAVIVVEYANLAADRRAAGQPTVGSAVPTGPGDYGRLHAAHVFHAVVRSPKPLPA